MDEGQRRHGRIAYVCLQRRGLGDAGDTHVDAVVAGLRRADRPVELFEASGSRRALVGRTVRALTLQASLIPRIGRYSVVYVRMHPLGALTIAAARWRRSRTIVEVNGVAEDYVAVHPGARPLRTLLRQLLAYQLRIADDVVAVTDGLARWVQETTGRTARVHVVPNAADPETFRPGLDRPASVPARYVLFAGALSPWQGLDIAVRAAVHESWPHDVALLIVGDGVLRDRIAAAAAASRGRIAYLGALPPRDVPPYVAGALATLALKQYHRPDAGQSPLKVYESLACGVPVIGPAMHGMVELLEGADAGVVVHDSDPSTVAEAVRFLADSEETRRQMGERGRRAVLQAHSWEHRVADILSIIDGRPRTARRPAS